MITLRPATMDDIEILRHWDEQPHVIESDPDTDWKWEVELRRDPDWREQLIAECDGIPIGMVQIIDPVREDSHYWGEIEENLRAIDIWIGEVEFLGRGFGTTMMNLALGKCFSNPLVQSVLIDPLASNLRAHRFYERIGFRFVEEREFGGELCHVYSISRSDFEKKKDVMNRPGFAGE